MSSTVPQKAHSKFERLVNIAIIVVAIFCVISIVRVSLQWARGRNERGPAKIGERLAIDKVHWSSSQQTLVLALSTTCHFCSESAPLYQRLVRELGARGDTRVIAVLPQTHDEAQKYLAGLGVSISEIHQADLLPELGIGATPTLLLADKNGVITDLWVGKLVGKDESEFLNRLGLQQVAAVSKISASDLKQLIKSKDVVVVDVNNRDFFRLNHVEGAVNIPLDELDTRAVNELAPTDKVVVYCHICESDEDSVIARDILLKNGFTQVSVLEGGLKSWESESPQKPPANQPPDSVKQKAAGSKR